MNLDNFINSYRVNIDRDINIDTLAMSQHIKDIDIICPELKIKFHILRSTHFESEIVEFRGENIFIFDVSLDRLIENVVNILFDRIPIEKKQELYYSQMLWLLAFRSLRYTKIETSIGLLAFIISDEIPSVFGKYLCVPHNKDENSAFTFLSYFCKSFVFYHEIAHVNLKEDENLRNKYIELFNELWEQLKQTISAEPASHNNIPYLKNINNSTLESNHFLENEKIREEVLCDIYALNQVLAWSLDKNLQSIFKNDEYNIPSMVYASNIFVHFLVQSLYTYDTVLESYILNDSFPTKIKDDRYLENKLRVDLRSLFVLNALKNDGQFPDIEFSDNNLLKFYKIIEEFDSIRSDFESSFFSKDYYDEIIRQGERIKKSKMISDEKIKSDLINIHKNNLKKDIMMMCINGECFPEFSDSIEE